MMGQLLEIEQIKNNDILIVGGGSSVLNYEIGKNIDSFSHVARINNFETSGYEKFVGSKVNYWCNGANQGLKKRKVLPENIIVFIPPKILQLKGELIHDRIQRRLGIKGSYHLQSLENMLKFESLVGSTRLTTGTNSILWAMENFSRVFIHGFDFFINSKTHYHDNPIKKWFIDKNIIKKGQKHNLELEKIFVENLILQKKIFLFKDYI